MKITKLTRLNGNSNYQRMNSDLGLNSISSSADPDARKNRNRSLAAEEREANKAKLAEWKERKKAAVAGGEAQTAEEK